MTMSVKAHKQRKKQITRGILKPQANSLECGYATEEPRRLPGQHLSCRWMVGPMVGSRREATFSAGGMLTRRAEAGQMISKAAFGSWEAGQIPGAGKAPGFPKKVRRGQVGKGGKCTSWRIPEGGRKAALTSWAQQDQPEVPASRNTFPHVKYSGDTPQGRVWRLSSMPASWMSLRSCVRLLAFSTTLGLTVISELI